MPTVPLAEYVPVWVDEERSDEVAPSIKAALKIDFSNDTVVCPLGK
jgi:hypothetical protein